MVSLLKREQKESVFSVLPSIDVLVVFPIRFGKCIIYQFFVMPLKAVAFVILPLKSICWRRIEGF